MANSSRNTEPLPISHLLRQDTASILDTVPNVVQQSRRVGLNSRKQAKSRFHGEFEGHDTYPRPFVELPCMPRILLSRLIGFSMTLLARINPWFDAAASLL